MNPALAVAIATEVLAKAAAFDSRTVGEGDILAWAEAIGDLDIDDALAAVTRHYRDSADWLKPVHVRRHVQAIARERARTAITAAATAPDCPHGQPGGLTLHPGTGEPLCALCRAHGTPNSPKGITP